MNRLIERTSLACRIFLAAIWLLASYSKVWEPQAFAHVVAVYDILPLWAVNSFSVIIAWLEIIIGLLLLAGWWIRPAAMWSSALLALYTAVMVHAGVTGAKHACGCFLHGPEVPAGYVHALQDFVLLLGALWVFRHPVSWRIRQKTDPLRPKI